jgi:hypothetical protein
MKTFLAIMLFWAAAAQAATVTMVWNANPASDGVTKYTLYENLAGTWTKVQDIGPTLTTLTLTGVSAGLHTYALTASNTAGESQRSTSAPAPIPPNPPSGFIIQTIVP